MPLAQRTLMSAAAGAVGTKGGPRTKAIAISDFILILPSLCLALARAGPVRRRALPLDEVQHGSASAQHGTQTRPRHKAPGSTRYWPAWHLRGACDWSSVGSRAVQCRSGQ